MFWYGTTLRCLRPMVMLIKKYNLAAKVGIALYSVKTTQYFSKMTTDTTEKHKLD